MTMTLMALLLAAAPAAAATPDCKSCDCEHWLWADRCKPCCEPVKIATVATREQFVDVLRLDAALAERVIEARKGKRIEKLTDLTLSRTDLDALEKKVSNLSPGQTKAILPSVELASEVADENDNPVNPDSAPFIVRVKGSVHATAGLYAYLVVRDRSAEWVEPSGELAVAAAKSGVQEFKDNCYLGQQRILPPSTGTGYVVFAVLVDRQYNTEKPDEHLDPATVRARSQEIRLRRTH